MEVYVTGHSHSASSTLHYIYYGTYKTGHGHYNQAHANPNGVTNRNALLFGINCHRGYQAAVYDFNRYLHQKPNNKVQTLNVVLSFSKSDFNFNKKEDCYRASEIAQNFVPKAFPNHQAIVALQHDNKNNIPHIHLIMNAISMKPPYYTIPAKSYGIGRLRRIGKKCIKSYDKQFRTQISGITTHTGNGYQKASPDQKHVIKAIDNVLELHQAHSHSTFRTILKNKFGIRASFKRRGSHRRRKRKRRGSRRYKRNGLTFKFITKDSKGKKRNHYVTASSLGRVQDSEDTWNHPSDYTLKGIDNRLEVNKKRAKQAQKNARKVDKEAHDLAIQQHKNRVAQRNIIKAERKKKNDKKRKRKLLQRQRSQRIAQIQSAVEESSQVLKQSAQERQRHQRQLKIDRKRSKKPFKRLSERLQHFTSTVKQVGGLRGVFTKYLSNFSKNWQNVQQKASGVVAWIRQLNPTIKKRQQKAQIQRQAEINRQRKAQKQHQNLIRAIHKPQKWYRDDSYDNKSRGGQHLELYLDRAFAYRLKNHKITILVTAHYRRDISKYCRGLPVTTTYDNKLKQNLHFQFISLSNFDHLLIDGGQQPVDKHKLSMSLNNHNGLNIINHEKTSRDPIAFKANVFPCHNTYEFNTASVTPSTTPFNYQHELNLKRQLEFNMSLSPYWKSYVSKYQYKNGTKPNPFDNKLLNNFQLSVDKTVRDQNRANNEPIKPCNYIERKLDNQINADPNNKYNYTKPWYVRGSDIPTIYGGHGREPGD